MNNPQTPEERDLLDTVWVELGASHPEPGNAIPSDSALSAPTPRQLVGCLVLVAAVTGCHFLVISRWDHGGPAWFVIAAAVVAVLGGGAAGFLLASRYCLAG